MFDRELANYRVFQRGRGCHGDAFKASSRGEFRVNRGNARLASTLRVKASRKKFVALAPTFLSRVSRYLVARALNSLRSREPRGGAAANQNAKMRLCLSPRIFDARTRFSSQTRHPINREKGIDIRILVCIVYDIVPFFISQATCRLIFLIIYDANKHPTAIFYHLSLLRE